MVQGPAVRAFQPRHYSDPYTITLGTSIIALSYNIVHSIMIQQTSAVTTTVLGQAKIVGLLLLSALLLGAHPPDHRAIMKGKHLMSAAFFEAKLGKHLQMVYPWSAGCSDGPDLPKPA